MVWFSGEFVVMHNYRYDLEGRKTDPIEGLTRNTFDAQISKQELLEYVLTPSFLTTHRQTLHRCLYIYIYTYWFSQYVSDSKHVSLLNVAHLLF